MENIEFGFENLDLWKKVRQFKKDIKEETKNFPSDEKYRLTDQLIRSSRSINSLLAEGHGRFTYADQIHFCIQARGSLSETINHLIDAFDENYILEEKLNRYKSQGKEIERLLNGYINYLRSQKEKEKT
jgi:four helix bundle protein